MVQLEVKEVGQTYSAVDGRLLVVFVYRNECFSSGESLVKQCEDAVCASRFLS